MSIQLDERILQFGTGKFLRCFADLFVHETNGGRTTPSGVVVVQSTGAERARALNRQGGHYHVAVRGLHEGKRVDSTVEVTSIRRALAADDDWAQVLDIARAESLQAIVSNVTEAGYRLDPQDAPLSLSVRGDPIYRVLQGASPPRPPEGGTTNAPRSFPAKLTAVLAVRWEAGLPGVTILPCELIEGNARQLLRLVLEVAVGWDLPQAFLAWVEGQCGWHDTLVDRIVSAPAPDDPWSQRDPLFAVAEPFALWLVEGKLDVAGFSEHPAVRAVDDLAPHHLRKVRILNGAHTALVAKARPLGIETVREAIENERIRPWLERLLFEEIVPTLEGRTDQPRRFAETTLERFANPFLEHRLADIALHHDVKLQTRLAPTRREFRQRFGKSPPLLDEILG